MQSVVTFVDEGLARQIATGLIGSEVRLTRRDTSSIGVNFKVLVRQDHGTEQSKATRTTDLLPEQIAHAIWEELKERAIDNLSDARQRLVAGVDGAFVPGTPILVTNVQFSSAGKASPAALSGEQCIRYQLEGGGGMLHAYTAVSSESVIDSLVGQPVAVAGVLRYTPAYGVPGPLSLSLALRICAVWLT